MSTWLASEFVPVRVGRVTRNRKTSVGADVRRILDDSDDAAADFLEGALQTRSEVANECAATRKRDVLPYTLLEFGFDFREQGVHRLDDWRDHRFASGLHFRGDVDFRGHAFDGNGHDDRILRRVADVAPLLFPL